MELLVGVAPPLRITSAGPSLEDYVQQNDRQTKQVCTPTSTAPSRARPVLLSPCAESNRANVSTKHVRSPDTHGQKSRWWESNPTLDGWRPCVLP